MHQQTIWSTAGGTVPPAWCPSPTVTPAEPCPASPSPYPRHPTKTHKSPPSLLKAQAKATTWSVARLMTGTQSMACSSQPNMPCSCCTSSCKGEGCQAGRRGARFCPPALHHTLQQAVLRGSCGMGSTTHGGGLRESPWGLSPPFPGCLLPETPSLCLLPQCSQAMAYRGEIFQLDRLLIFHHTAQAPCRQLGSE